MDLSKKKKTPLHTIFFILTGGFLISLTLFYTHWRKPHLVLHTLEKTSPWFYTHWRKPHLGSTHIGQNLTLILHTREKTSPWFYTHRRKHGFFLFNLILSSEGLVGSELMILCLFAQILHSFRNTYICKQ